MAENTDNVKRYVAFAGTSRIAAGDVRSVISAAWQRQQEGLTPILIFDTSTGRQIDFDLRGTLQEALDRVLPPEPQKGPGRPRIGVVCREICLLPRQWEWLDEQSQSASAIVRRLVDKAKKEMPREEIDKRLLEAAGRFMWVVAGDLEGFEEASRALYAQRWSTLDRFTEEWPEDVRSQIFEMTEPVRQAPEG